MKIITEEIYRGELRYFVIKEPINDTGICFSFEKREDAENFIADHAKKETKRARETGR